MFEITDGAMKKDNPEKLATLSAHLYAQADTHYVSKTCALLQTTEAEHRFFVVAKIATDITTM
jgi:hypothetical protein